MSKPLTLNDIEDLLRLELPETQSRAGWTINRDELLRCVKAIPVLLPVKVKVVHNGKWRWGTHYAREGRHLIILNGNRFAREANETLLHELAHARQAEGFAQITGKPQTDFYRVAYKQHGSTGGAYERNPFEIQAREFAATNKTAYRLVVG
jgi:hypothetical protein